MSETSVQAPLPAAMAEIAEDFGAVTARDRLQLLLEFSDGLPDLPERYAGQPDKLERVDECQSPIFLVVEVGEGGTPDERTVSLFFQAPPEAPTTRGFAGILHEGLDGLSVGEVLAVPEDAPYRFGLAEAVSPLRLRGMVGMLGRIKRQVRLKSAVASTPAP
ncbi:MAG: SufE family protein [Actinomycetota bacterium]|nr:SufE family protein [Actinomycetota bacterium]